MESAVIIYLLYQTAFFQRCKAMKGKNGVVDHWGALIRWHGIPNCSKHLYNVCGIVHARPLWPNECTAWSAVSTGSLQVLFKSFSKTSNSNKQYNTSYWLLYLWYNLTYLATIKHKKTIVARIFQMDINFLEIENVTIWLVFQN